MPQQAHVQSVEAIEAFKANLNLYLAKAGPTLEEIRAEAFRVRVWLQSDRRPYWESQLRRRTTILEQAQQALFRARLSNLGDATTDGKSGVQKAKHAVEEAEAKLKLLKTWNRDFDNRVLPLLKQLEDLSSVLVHHMPRAVACLSQAVGTLSDYAGVSGRSLLSEEARPHGSGVGHLIPPEEMPPDDPNVQPKEAQ